MSKNGKPTLITPPRNIKGGSPPPKMVKKGVQPPKKVVKPKPPSGD